MSKKKLTLSVEERLSKRAKAIAEERGTSVSRLVETFFTTLEGVSGAEAAGGPSQGAEDAPDEEGGPHDPPALSDWAHRWRGAFKEADRTYPDDPSWEEEVVAEEIEEKHA